MIRWLLAFWLALSPAFAGSSQTLIGVGSGGGAAAYSGPGDVVPGATMWAGLRAYSAATRGQPAANVCNAGDAACVDMVTDATTGALVITTVGGTNCGSSTCTVKKLYDQTVGNNCAAASCDLIQNTEANRPVLVTSCINSKPCMTGNGSQSVVTANGLTLPEPLTISAIGWRTTGSGVFSVIVGQISFGAIMLTYWVGANQAAIYDGTQLTATAADDAFHAFEGIFNGASSAIYVDGVGTTGAIAGSQSFANNIGFLTGNFGTITGKGIEMGIWGSAISGGDAVALSSNQTGFWGPF